MPVLCWLQAGEATETGYRKRGLRPARSRHGNEPLEAVRRAARQVRHRKHLQLTRAIKAAVGLGRLRTVLHTPPFWRHKNGRLWLG